MKIKALLAGLVLVSMAVPAAAQAPSQVPSQAPEFSAEAFRAHVAVLADDRMEGRAAGTRGYDLAADYVAGRFAALGLRPGAPGESWLQPIEFVRLTNSGAPRLTVGGHTLTHGQEMLVHPGADRRPASFEAPLVFAGYGLDMPSYGFDDYRGIDARGRIVVVLDGYPRGTASDVGAHLGGEKARMAAARGAVGLITVRTRPDPDGAGWRRYLAAADRAAITWVGRDGQPYFGHDLRFTAVLDRESAASLFEGERRSLDQLIEATVPNGGRPGSFAMTRIARFERQGVEAARFTSPNVLAILPGTDPALADEYVLMMAHLDGLGVSQDGEGDRIRNGAMDNATGISTLIEVAREMSRPGNRPRRPILFAAVTAEEVGLLGAEYLARNPATQGRVAAVVNLDMPVLTYDFRDVIAFGAEHSTLGPIVARAAEGIGVALTPDPLPQEGLFTRSDHYKFVREGVPAVFLMTGFAGEGQERFTSFLRNQYHGPDDDLSLPFDWEAGAKFARLNYLIARAIADADRAPLWYADSFFGNAFAGTQERAQRPAGGRAGSR